MVLVKQNTTSGDRVQVGGIVNSNVDLTEKIRSSPPKTAVTQKNTDAVSRLIRVGM